MADKQPPWERFSNADVKPQSSDTDLPPWERFSHVQTSENPEAGDAIHVEDMAQETEKAMSRMTYTPPDSNTWTGWTARATRAMGFGASDVITAKILHRQIRDENPDIGYEEVLGAVREGYSKDVSMSAEVVGMLAPGTLLAKGVTKGGKAAMDAMSKTGILKGTMAWLGRDKFASRLVQASVGGATGGAGFEAIRVSVENAIDEAGGIADQESVRDAAMNGAVVGAFLGPVANESLRGAGGVVNWVKQTFGNSDQQTISASKRILKTLANEGETPDAAVERIRNDAQQFMAENGRPPALFEIISPDQAREISDVSRYYNGLSPRLRDLTEAQVDNSIKTLERAVSGSKPLMDKEVIESTVENQFTDMMGVHGDRMVQVGDDAMNALAQNKGFLTMQAKHNPEARAILRTVEAKENIATLRADTSKLINSRNLADDAAEISDINVRIAEILDEQLNASNLAPSELAALQNLKRMQGALSSQMDKAAKAGYAEANVNNMIGVLRSAESLLANYEKNGFKVSLRSANAMRHAASRGARNASDLSAQAEAIGVRDAIAPVGTAEVPSYGRLVKLWGRQMTRAEAHATGKEAVRGQVSPENLAVRTEQGRLPGRPRAKVLSDIRKGVEEGARIDLRSSTRSTPGAAAKTAESIAESPDIQANIRRAIPGEGGEKIVGSAQQTKRTIDNARAANSNKSPSELQEEVAAVRDQVESLVLGNLGGAGKANLVARYMMRFRIPRKTANKVIDMLGDPAKMDDALRFVATKGIDLKEFVAVLGNATVDAENKNRESRR